MAYRVKIQCGNCCFKNVYEIERETEVGEADLVCPNCGCCPTGQEYVILYKDKLYGKAKQQIEENIEGQRPQTGRPDTC